MDFREATDGLFARVDHETLAKVLGVSVAAIRQARLRDGAHAYRAPPNEWVQAVIRLAEDRAAHYAGLVDRLRREASGARLTNCHQNTVVDQSLRNNITDKESAALLTDGG
jgi:hypothetical protein